MLVRRYNPITMKPATLEPYIPLHLPLIWGPDPSAGSSYGCYQNEQKTMVVSKKQESVYCPITGKKMKFIGDIDAMEFEKSSADVKKHSTCSNCQSDIFSNFDVSDEFSCWNCGHPLKGEKKTMSKIKEIRKSIEAKISIAEEGEFVSIDKLLTELEKGKEKPEKAEKAEPEKSEPAAEEPVEAEITTAKEPPEKEEKEEPESKEEPEDEEVSEEVSDEIEEQVADEVADQVSDEIEDQVSDQVSEEIGDQVSDEVSDQVSEEIEDNIEDIAEEVSEQVSEEVKEHIEDTIDDLNETNEEETEEEKEEMIDLDIVLSMAKKARKEDMVDLSTVISMVEEKSRREEAFKSVQATIENKIKSEEIMKTEKEKTIARLRAKARANILKKRVEAEITITKAEEKEEEIVVVAPPVVESPIEEAKEEEFAILEVPASDVPAAPAPEELSMSPEAHHEHELSESPAEEATEESEALRYETLSSLDDVKSYGKEDVELVLFNERTNNPTWMVFCKTTPLAKVECAKQADADAIREVFASESFAKDFVDHCADIGLIESLKNVNASFFANETSDKKIEARFEAKAEAKIAKFKAQSEAKLRTDLMRALDVVTVGMTKNLYSDVGHPLKDALFEGMTLAGLPENTAASVVNASFAAGAAAYYQVVFEKAIAFMNMNETAQSELKHMISDASVISHEINENDMNLNERLSRASSVASLRPYDVSVRPSISVDRDSYKARLKATMKK